MKSAKKRGATPDAEPLPRTKKQKKQDPVKQANALEGHEFLNRFLPGLEEHHSRNRDYFIIHDTAGFLLKHSPDRLDECLDLIQKTSQQDYVASTIGWNVPHKKKEMSDSLMHYLVVYERMKGKIRIPDTPPPLLGFCSFMLTYDSSPAVPVLYIYEIHLTKELRRTGLGTKLISICERVARDVGVDKVMLTCFKRNTDAQRFYERLGFEKDVVSPEARQVRNKTIEVDILILSKVVKSSDHDTDTGGNC